MMARSVAGQVIPGAPPGGVPTLRRVDVTASWDVTSLNLGATPQVGDLLVLGWSNRITGSSLSNVSGCGATWAQQELIGSTGSNARASLWIGTGADGVGSSVSWTPTSQSLSRVAVWTLSGGTVLNSSNDFGGFNSTPHYCAAAPGLTTAAALAFMASASNGSAQGMANTPPWVDDFVASHVTLAHGDFSVTPPSNERGQHTPASAADYAACQVFIGA